MHPCRYWHRRTRNEVLFCVGRAQLREFEETKFQLEEDADREIDQQKGRYEARLAHEREVSLRLKGENGIMKKKFNVLQRDIAAQVRITVLL